MFFKRPIQRYGQTPEPVTPYQRAEQLWDERIGASRVQARNWRLMAFGCFSTSVALSGALVWQSIQSRVVPYFVEGDKFGGARDLAPLGGNHRAAAPPIASPSPTERRRVWEEGVRTFRSRGAPYHYKENNS